MGNVKKVLIMTLKQRRQEVTPNWEKSLKIEESN